MHCVHVILTHFTHNSDSHGFHDFSHASCMSEKNSALFLTLPASDTCSYEVCLGTYSLVLSKNAAKAWEWPYCNLIVLSWSPIATSGSDFVALVFIHVRVSPAWKNTEKKLTIYSSCLMHAFCANLTLSYSAADSYSFSTKRLIALIYWLMSACPYNLSMKTTTVWNIGDDNLWVDTFNPQSQRPIQDMIVMNRQGA